MIEHLELALFRSTVKKKTRLPRVRPKRCTAIQMLQLDDRTATSQEAPWKIRGSIVKQAPMRRGNRYPPPSEEPVC